jgi:hypothetical protein
MASATSARLARGSLPARKKPPPSQNPDESSDVVKEIHEEENKDEVAKTDFSGGPQVKLQESARRMRQGKKMRRPMTTAERNSG